MSTLIKGATHQVAVKVVGETDTIDSTGKRVITSAWDIDYSQKENFIAGMTTHPASGLKRASVRSERGKLNVARVTITFGGLDPAEVIIGYKASYRQGRSNSTEPIETHPKFFQYAGYPDPNKKSDEKHAGRQNEDGTGNYMHGIWKNGQGDTGADRVKSATFIGWGTWSDIGKKFQGMMQYNNPNITWTETIVSVGKPSVNMRTGTIDNPPGGAPSVSKFSGTRNWLLDSAEQEENGSAWTTTRTWLMSGEKGWLSEWYDAS